MAESLAQLQDALRDCSTLERELGRRGMANTYRVLDLEQDLDFVGTNRLVQLAGVISLLSVAFSCAPASSPSTSAPRPIAVGACQALQPTSVGGPAAPPATIVLRWLGTANYEVTYKGLSLIHISEPTRP